MTLDETLAEIETRGTTVQEKWLYDDIQRLVAALREALVVASEWASECGQRSIGSIDEGRILAILKGKAK